MRIVSTATSAIFGIIQLCENLTNVSAGVLSNLDYALEGVEDETKSVIGELGYIISYTFDYAGNDASEVVSSLTEGAGTIITST